LITFKNKAAVSANKDKTYPTRFLNIQIFPLTIFLYTFAPVAPMIAPVVEIAALQKKISFIVMTSIYFFFYSLVCLSMFLFAPIKLCNAVIVSNKLLVSPLVYKII
jgi:hypothetical protein